MTIRAALLDASGVFLRVDALSSPADLTARHLAQITECDLPAGAYRWIADDANPYGGAFWPLTWLKRIADDLAEEARLAARKADRERRALLPPAAQVAEIQASKGRRAKTRT